MPIIPVPEADQAAAIVDGDTVIDEDTVEVLPDYLAEHDALHDGPDA